MTDRPEQQDNEGDWVEPISLEDVEEGGDDDYQTKAYKYWLMRQEGKEKAE